MPSLDTILGIVGLLVAIFAIFDNRRERNKRERAVIAAHAAIERAYGLLIGIKPAVEPTFPKVAKAIDDGLTAINQHRDTLKKL